MIDPSFFAILCDLLPKILYKTAQPIDVFLDTNRLKDVRNFREDFADAIVNTQVIVPIISNCALERMQLLTEHSEVDMRVL